MWTRYSNNLSWALMPWILKIFKIPHSRRATTIPESFLTMTSSSSCSVSLHFNIVMINTYNGAMRRRLTTQFNLLNKFLLSKKYMKIRFSALAGESFTQREILAGALKPTYKKIRFPQVLNGPHTRMPEHT
jgi:hypothetical protein